MKRVGLWAVGIGVIASVGLLTIAHGFANGNDGATKCTLATLKGRYLFAAPAILFPPAFGVTETSVGNAAGFHIFDGNGKGQDYGHSPSMGLTSMYFPPTSCRIL